LWEQRFQQLVEYNRTHGNCNTKYDYRAIQGTGPLGFRANGDCNVPEIYHLNPSLVG
jgi:hypothetical protein